jgi:hypothetical protein
MNKFSKKINCIIRVMSFLGMFFVLSTTYAGDCTQSLCKCSLNKADSSACVAGESHACFDKAAGVSSSCYAWCEAHTTYQCGSQQ